MLFHGADALSGGVADAPRIVCSVLRLQELLSFIMHPIRSILVLAALTLAPTAVHSATATDAALAEKTASAYRRSAEQGDADAALRLGNMVSRNTVPAEKFGTASDWYLKGCALGSLSACHNAGVAYQFGRNGVKRDYYEAAKYYLKAADRAFLPSQINLVVLYANGQVISQDHREGLKWMLIAQKSAMQCVDNPACRSILDDKSGYRKRLEAQLSEREQHETREMADAWRPVR